MLRVLIRSVLLLGLFTQQIEAADLDFASIFSDHMILQRDRDIPIWGVSNPDESIEIRFADQVKKTTADSTGKWVVYLSSIPASTSPRELKVSSTMGGERSKVLSDVVVGDVWLASGQSNMEWEMGWKSDSKQDIPAAHHPNIRIIQIPLEASVTPRERVNAKWDRCTPESVATFSAVGYYFGLKLNQELDVPIGIIQSAWGGTRIEPWTDADAFLEIPALRELGETIQSQSPGNPSYNKLQNQYFAQLEGWLRENRERVAKGESVAPMPSQPQTLKAEAGTPTALYNAMIHPLVPFGLKGAIWYQGESNHGEGFSYVDKTAALLHSWRTRFANPNLPFYFVQIAPYQYGDEDPEILAQFWIAQQQCQRIPDTGMAVIHDLAEIGDIHPAQKKEVARRLALWALAKNYGRTEIDPMGPTFKSYRVEGNRIRVEWDHTKGGLKSRDNKALSNFEIAGADGAFVAAEAKIDGNTIVVSAPEVKAPKQVRFAWSKLAIPNLMNADGLTASPFHTHWPVDPDLGENVALHCKILSSDANQWGWNGGLTDGKWGSNAPECFATGIAESFPKHVIVELNENQPINLIRFGVPNIGSTKTVSVSVSQDGKSYDELGKHQFQTGKSERATIRFADRKARFIKLTFVDFHDQETGGYSKFFGFLSEVEVFRSR